MWHLKEMEGKKSPAYHHAPKHKRRGRRVGALWFCGRGLGALMDPAVYMCFWKSRSVPDLRKLCLSNLTAAQNENTTSHNLSAPHVLIPYVSPSLHQPANYIDDPMLHIIRCCRQTGFEQDSRLLQPIFRRFGVIKAEHWGEMRINVLPRSIQIHVPAPSGPGVHIPSHGHSSTEDRLSMYIRKHVTVAITFQLLTLQWLQLWQLGWYCFYLVGQCVCLSVFIEKTKLQSASHS